MEPSWYLRKNQDWLENSSIESFARGRWRRYRRWGNQKRLASLQFQRVIDVIVFLQLGDTDVVRSRDGSERFAAGNDVAVAVVSFDGRFRRRGSRCRGCGCRCCGRAFANYDAGTLVGQLRLELKNLLRKHVDLCILLIDLFCQLLNLRSLS